MCVCVCGWVGGCTDSLTHTHSYFSSKTMYIYATTLYITCVYVCTNIIILYIYRQTQ